MRLSISDSLHDFFHLRNVESSKANTYTSHSDVDLKLKIHL